MADKLSDLPEELIGEIARRLGDDKFALRATCRKIERASFHEFATEHFSGKCVHFTTDSLGALLAISRCERLAKYVKEVSVVTALFSEQAFACARHSSPCRWKPSTRQSEAYRFYINDQKTLCATGNDRVMLAEAFKGLKSLKTIALIDNIECTKEGTDYRGGNKVLRQTGTHPIGGLDSLTRINSLEFRKHLEHLWSTLVHAIAETHGYLSLEEFRTNILTSGLFVNPLKQLSFDASVLSKLSKVFANTAVLHLHMKSPERKGYKEAVGSFTRTFSNLRTLCLDFDMTPNSGPLYHKMALSIEMARLTSLSLSGLSVDAPRLVTSVIRLNDIKELKLYHMDLTSGTWPPVLKAIGNLEHLGHLHLMYLRENGHKSYFLKQNTDGRPAADDLGLGGGWGDDDDDDDEIDELEEGNITDESMPDLDALLDEPPAWIQPMLDYHPTAQQPGNQDQANHDTPANDDDDDMSEYVPDNHPPNQWGGERGFYICVKGHEKIAKRLPRFIEEYNVGEYMDALAHLPVTFGTAGVATMTVNTTNMLPPAPPGFNAIMAAAIGNSLGPLGTQPPPNNNNTTTNNNNAAGANYHPLGGLPNTHPPPPTPYVPMTSVPATGPAANANANAPQGSTHVVPDWDGSGDEGDWEDEDDALDGGEVD